MTVRSVPPKSRQRIPSRIPPRGSEEPDDESAVKSVESVTDPAFPSAASVVVVADVGAAVVEVVDSVAVVVVLVVEVAVDVLVVLDGDVEEVEVVELGSVEVVVDASAI
jgi:hypothetical protein